MFSEKALSDVIKRVTFCVSKCSDKENIPLLAERISRLLMPKPTITDASRQLLQEIVSKQRILFFRKPSFEASTLPGKKMVEICSAPSQFWRVNKNAINYHVLINDNEEDISKEYLGAA